MYRLEVKRMIIFLTLLLLFFLTSCMQNGAETPGQHVPIKWLLMPIAPENGTLRSFALQSACEGEFQWGKMELSIGPYDPQDKYLTTKANDDIALFEEMGYFLDIKVYGDYYESEPLSVVLPVNETFLMELTRAIDRSGLTSKSSVFDEVEEISQDTSHFLVTMDYSSGKKMSYSLPIESDAVSEDFFRQIYPLLHKELKKYSHSFIPFLNILPGISPNPQWIQTFSFHRSSDKLENNTHFSFTQVSGEPVFSGSFYSTETKQLVFCDHVVLTPKEEKKLLDLFVQSKLFFLPEEAAENHDLPLCEGIEQVSLVSFSTEKSRDEAENYWIVPGPCTDWDCKSSFFLLLTELTEKYAEIY